MEIWQPIASLPEYVASSYGRVMRVPYEGQMPRGGKRKYGGVPTFGQWSEKDPRPAFVFRRKNYRVSRLICEAFHGPAPFARAVVMHIDDNPTNNCPENLKWGTNKENLNTPAFLAYCRSRIGENSPVIKGRHL